MEIQTYRENRAKFSEDELKPYDGKWVAFSADGSRIVAAAESIQELHEKIVASGETPENVKLEKVVLEDDWMGAAIELQ